MDNLVVSRALLLSYDEIRILLYSQGFRKCEGVFMPQHEYTQKEILETMNALSQRKLIRAEGDAFSISDEMHRMLEVIGNPGGTFILRTVPGGPSYYCYVVPDTVVVSEKYFRKKDTLRLRMFTPQAFTDWKEQVENDYREYSDPGYGKKL